MCRKARVRQSARKGPLDTEATLKWAGQGDLVLALELTLLYHTFPPTHQRRERREPPELANQCREPFWVKIDAKTAQDSRQFFKKLFCGSADDRIALRVRNVPFYYCYYYHFFLKLFLCSNHTGLQAGNSRQFV